MANLHAYCERIRASPVARQVLAIITKRIAYTLTLQPHVGGAVGTHAMAARGEPMGEFVLLAEARALRTRWHLEMPGEYVYEHIAREVVAELGCMVKDTLESLPTGSRILLALYLPVAVMATSFEPEPGISRELVTYCDLRVL